VRPPLFRRQPLDQVGRDADDLLALVADLDLRRGAAAVLVGLGDRIGDRDRIPEEDGSDETDPVEAQGDGNRSVPPEAAWWMIMVDVVDMNPTTRAPCAMRRP